MMANNSQQQPMQANTGQQQPTKAAMQAHERRTAAGGLETCRVLSPGMFFLFSFPYILLTKHYLQIYLPTMSLPVAGYNYFSTMIIFVHLF